MIMSNMVNNRTRFNLEKIIPKEDYKIIERIVDYFIARKKVKKPSGYLGETYDGISSYLINEGIEKDTFSRAFEMAESVGVIKRKNHGHYELSKKFYN